MLLNTVKKIGTMYKTPVLSFVRHKAAYEGDGKTTVRVINKEQDLGLMIDSYAKYGFRLNNGITVLGPMAIFPSNRDLPPIKLCWGMDSNLTVISWQVRGSYEVTEGALRLFKLLAPKIDLLIIGLETDERKGIDTVFKAARANGLNVEILATEHACSTFNFLNAEGRSVAAAMIPPLIVTMNEDDMLQSQLHYKNLYKGDL